MTEDLEERSDSERLGNAEEGFTLKGLWETYEPKDFYDKLWAASSPGSYVLWKMPLYAHEKVNRILDYATAILAGPQPEIALATGMTAGISQVVYGLKTMDENQDSGRHVLSGLSKILGSAEKIDHPKTKQLSKDIRQFMDEHLDVAI